MAIDYGTKRIGIALTDPLKITAQPFTALENNSKIVEEIHKIIKEKNVSRIVLGNPLRLNGEVGLASEAVAQFAQKLKELGLPIILQDERMTTAEATKRMIESDVKRQDRKNIIDQTAAALILQQYLASPRQPKADTPFPGRGAGERLSGK